MRADFSLGVASLWNADRRTTWSGIPWGLERALAKRTHVSDAWVCCIPMEREALARVTRADVREYRISFGEFTTAWQARCELEVKWRLRRSRADALLQIGRDLAIVDRPFYCYRDLSYEIILERPPYGLAFFAALDDARVRRLVDRQDRFNEAASAIFVASEWLRSRMLDRSPQLKGKIHVVPFAANNLAPHGNGDQRGISPPSLLFVGRHFRRKGGDLVVEALRMLRAGRFPDLTLTVVGPLRWPGGGDPPAGVRFLGRADQGTIRQLLASHDVYVMPSRFEPFGIAFCEALAAGLPCIGRRAFAMPEIIRPGVNGALVDGDDPSELAGVIAEVLEDEGLRRRCLEGRQSAAAYWSWDRAAEQVLGVISGGAARS